MPATSRHFTTARLTSAVTLLSGRSINEVTEQHIRDAARRVEALPDTEPRVLQIRALVLGTAMDWIADNTASTNHILGFPFTEHGLQLGVEASLRSLARVAPTQAHRYALVDLANSVRPHHVLNVLTRRITSPVSALARGDFLANSHGRDTDSVVPFCSG